LKPEPFLVPPNTTAWVITDGKIGDEVHCFGIAQALGVVPERKLVEPKAPWSWFAPYGPPDLRDWPGRAGSPIAPPFPDIAIASGRRTVPYLRAVKKASGGRTFTVFSKDPYRGRKTADVVYVPEHDKLRGDNVIATLTSPHRLTAAGFAAARAHPDRRLAALPQPRAAFILGGPSGQYTFTPADAERLAAIARKVVSEGHSLLVTPSRRTPDFVTDAIRAALAEAVAQGRAFVWDGSGDNPYLAILALAEAVLITGDSVNMIGESAMSGAPIHIIETTGGHPKMTWFIDRMIAEGAARRWTGAIERFSYEPIDATPQIARGIAERYRAFLGRQLAANAH
jgi:uncharacterized protein